MFGSAKLLGLGLALGVLVGAGVYLYQTGRENGKAAIRSEQAKALEALAVERDAADQRYRHASRDLFAANSEIGRLRAYRVPNPKVLIREVPTDAPVSACPDRSSDFRVRYNALASGVPPDEIAPEPVPPPARGESSLSPPRLVGSGDAGR